MAPGGSFLTFDAILSSASATKANPYERHNAQELAFANNASQPCKITEDNNKSQDSSKKRWSLLKSIIPSSSPKDRPKTSSAKTTPAAPPTSSSAGSNDGPSSKGGAVDGTAAGSAAPSYRALSFKISLEWIDQDISNLVTGRERRLYPPELPLPAQLSLQQSSSSRRRTEGADEEGVPDKDKDDKDNKDNNKDNDKNNNTPLEPVGVTAGPSKYAGRALAEWAILIAECQNFFERRKAEGVPSYQLVETPTLGVDPFRKV